MSSNQVRLFREKQMAAYLIGGAIGALIGAIVIAGAIFGTLEHSMWQKEQRDNQYWITLVYLAMAENAKLRLSLAEGQMTEDSKKVAAMTVDAIETVLASKRDELQEIRARQNAQQ
jgi:hypothetical protein